MKVINWIKANPLIAVVLVAALILLFFAGSTIKKTEEKLTSITTEKDTLQIKYDTVSKEYAEYKKTSNSDMEWVSEPVLDKNGKPLLDGQGHAIFRKRLTKRQQSSSTGSTTSNSITNGTSDSTHSAGTTIIQEKTVTVGKQIRVVINLGMSLDAVNATMPIKTKLKADVALRLFMGLGVNVSGITPLNFKKEGMEIYAGPSFFF